MNQNPKKSSPKSQPAKVDYDSEGFITADGETVPIQDTDRVFSILVKSWGGTYEMTPFLRYLAEKCTDSGEFGAAYVYLEKILPLVDAPMEKAECLLRMGQVMEKSRDSQFRYSTISIIRL